MPLPVLTVAQMREWEQSAWSAGRSEAEVIRQVGKCVAALALRMTQPGDLILILAGKGHNGDDARCSREHLVDRRAEVLNITQPEADLAELERLLLSRPELVIDGLFGIGLNRALAPEWVRLFSALNEAKVRVLAVDVPSGLDAETGNHHGAVIQAAVTLTVGAPKLGLLQEHAAAATGRVEVATSSELGPCPASSELLWTTAEDFTRFPPTRPVSTHKGSYGHLAIVAGSVGYHGASVLSTRGAQRAQPGLITLHTMEEAYHAVAPQLQAAMVSPWSPELTLPGAYSAALIGPGLAATDLPDKVKTTTRTLWRDSEAPVIVDASALDWLPENLPARNQVRVITPHPGEAARMLRTTPAKIQADRVKALRELSKRYAGAWVVLKGNHTLVGRSSGPIFVNSSGNPFLAQGGSGDVLSGFIAGFLAQPSLRNDPATVLRYAVWQHGAAADWLQANRPGWVVEDLVNVLGSVPPGCRNS